MREDRPREGRVVRREQSRRAGAHLGILRGGELAHEGFRFYFILNAYWGPLEFELPPLSAGSWRRWIDTALDSPNDIVPWEHARDVSGKVYPTAARSVVMLFANCK